MVRDLWGPHDPRVPRAASDLVKAMTRVAAQLTEEGLHFFFSICLGFLHCFLGDTASAAALLKKGEKWTSTNEFPGDAVTRKRLRLVLKFWVLSLKFKLISTELQFSTVLVRYARKQTSFIRLFTTLVGIFPNYFVFVWCFE